MSIKFFKNNIFKNNIFKNVVLKSNFLKRTISIIIFAPLFLLALVFARRTLLIILTILMFYEWYKIVIHRNNKLRNNKLCNFILGVLYILIPMIFWIVNSYEFASFDNPLIMFIILVWSCDTFAYIGGNLIGGKKFAPSISPNKTWSGVICGIILASLITIITANFVLNKEDAHLNWMSVTMLIVLLLLSIGVVLGDLLESKIKRIYGIKDSGNLIPGHGGILDRFDGFLGATWILLILIILIIFISLGSHRFL